MATLLTKIDRERTLDQSKESTAVEKICLVTLAKDAPRPLELEWCKGRGFKKTLLILRPGETIQQPLDKCHAWFGPFDLFKVYENTHDEKTLEVLRDHISIESARFLSRYDYPRELGEGYKPNMTPSGPHRAPDVTITVLNADGTSEEPVRLHQIYGIGEFDELKDTFKRKETVEEIRARFEADLRAKDEEVRKMRHDLAELAGVVKGAMAPAEAEKVVDKVAEGVA